MRRGRAGPGTAGWLTIVLVTGLLRVMATPAKVHAETSTALPKETPLTEKIHFDQKKAAHLKLI